jgi:acyl-CoA thioesterase YciA
MTRSVGLDQKQLVWYLVNAFLASASRTEMGNSCAGAVNESGGWRSEVMPGNDGLSYDCSKGAFGCNSLDRQRRSSESDVCHKSSDSNRPARIRTLTENIGLDEIDRAPPNSICYSSSSPEPLDFFAVAELESSVKPQGEIVIRAIAMPSDTNSNGDIFGGWVISQMDLGGAVIARNAARSRVVTAAIEAMSFVAPVSVGDLVTCYAQLQATGRTSMKVAVEVWTERYSGEPGRRVTHGLFTYVAIDSNGKPQPVERQGNPAD